MSHIHELIDFTVCAYIVNENRVLLVHHKKLDKWLPVGGHIELNETPDEALFREIQEESGLTKKHLTALTHKSDLTGRNTSLLIPNDMDIHQISETHRHIGLVYYLTSDTDKVKLAATEHHQIKWFSMEELKDTELILGAGVAYYTQQATDLRCQKLNSAT